MSFTPRSLRKGFLLALTLLLAWPSFTAADEKPDSKLRVIAYNVYECTGWPKDRERAHVATALGQMPQRFAMELALHSPDIINLSEAPKEPVVAEIARLLKMNYVFFPSGGKWPGALLTRHTIVRSANAPDLRPAGDKTLFTRHWGMAELKLANGTPLVVHSAHLHPSDSAVRQREIAEMLSSMKGDLAAGRPMILMGDLNHEPLPPEYDLWLKGGWVDGHSIVKAGNDQFTFAGDDLKRRIDYVFAAGPLARSIIESRPLSEGAFRLNTADPLGFALSDHFPQLCVFELAK